MNTAKAQDVLFLDVSMRFNMMFENFPGLEVALSTVVLQDVSATKQYTVKADFCIMIIDINRLAYLFLF